MGFCPGGSVCVLMAVGDHGEGQQNFSSLPSIHTLPSSNHGGVNSPPFFLTFMSRHYLTISGVVTM